jgi:hypothetical protein
MKLLTKLCYLFVSDVHLELEKELEFLIEQMAPLFMLVKINTYNFKNNLKIIFLDQGLNPGPSACETLALSTVP